MEVLAERGPTIVGSAMGYFLPPYNSSTGHSAGNENENISRSARRNVTKLSGYQQDVALYETAKLRENLTQEHRVIEVKRSNFDLDFHRRRATPEAEIWSADTGRPSLLPFRIPGSWGVERPLGIFSKFRPTSTVGKRQNTCRSIYKFNFRFCDLVATRTIVRVLISRRKRDFRSGSGGTEPQTQAILAFCEI